jgi:SulP family sulfate permease
LLISVPTYINEEEDSEETSTLSEDQPLPLLIQTFASYPDSPPTSWFAQLTPYLTRQTITANQQLWKQGDLADALYLIEIGSLRANYDHGHDHSSDLRAGTGGIQETMVAGTVAGDLSMLSGTIRNATVVAERDGVVWRLDRDSLERMEAEKPEVAREFIKIVLRCKSFFSGLSGLGYVADGVAVAEEHDVLAAHLIAVLS